MSERKLIIILNGVSRKKTKFYKNILPTLSQHYDVAVWETQHQEHGIELGKKAALEKPFGVLAAGGDGTLNQVLNGLFQSNLPVLPPLGIIPLGTGNDFARLGKIKSTSDSILKKIQQSPQRTDVGTVDCCDINGNPVTRYFINVASLGMGPAVVTELFKSNRAFGPTITYLQAILKVFFTKKPEALEIKTKDWTWSGKARVVAIANGQSFGGGIFIAPDAQPNDGVLSTFVAGNLPTHKFLFVLQQIKMKIKATDKRIRYDVCSRVSLSSPEVCWIETEGELAGVLPATIQIKPKAISFFR